MRFRSRLTSDWFMNGHYSKLLLDIRLYKFRICNILITWLKKGEFLGGHRWPVPFCRHLYYRLASKGTPLLPNQGCLGPKMHTWHLGEIYLSFRINRLALWRRTHCCVSSSSNPTLALVPLTRITTPLSRTVAQPVPNTTLDQEWDSFESEKVAGDETLSPMRREVPVRRRDILQNMSPFGRVGYIRKHLPTVVQTRFSGRPLMQSTRDFFPVFLTSQTSFATLGVPHSTMKILLKKLFPCRSPVT